MAMVPRAGAVAGAQPIASASSVAANSRVAAVASSQVDALNSGTNISFDASASGFQENRTRPQLGEERRERQFAERGSVRLFKADSQVFAKIFEARTANADEGKQRGRTTEAGGTIASAIGTYENNAVVISGNAPIRGTTFSFRL